MKYVRGLRVLNNVIQPGVGGGQLNTVDIEFRGVGGSGDVRVVNTVRGNWAYNEQIQVTNVPVNQFEVWSIPGPGHVIGTSHPYRALLFTAASVGDSVLNLDDLMRVVNMTVTLPSGQLNDQFAQILRRLDKAEWNLTTRWDSSGTVNFPGGDSGTALE